MGYEVQIGCNWVVWAGVGHTTSNRASEMAWVAVTWDTYAGKTRVA